MGGLAEVLPEGTPPAIADAVGEGQSRITASFNNIVAPVKEHGISGLGQSFLNAVQDPTLLMGVAGILTMKLAGGLPGVPDLGMVGNIVGFLAGAAFGPDALDKVKDAFKPEPIASAAPAIDYDKAAPF